MRWLWIQRTDPSRPWSQLPFQQEHMVTDLFHTSITVQVGNGHRSFFWTDRWIRGRSVAEIAPALLTAVRLHARRKRTVAQGLINNAWVSVITGALTVQVIIDYLLIWDLVTQCALHPTSEDRFIWKWTADGQFTVASAYRAFFIGQHAIPRATILQKTRAPGRVKFFLWLVLHDRCWTACRRKRHGLQEGDRCIFCDQHSETISHLLTQCYFAREVWFKLLRRWGQQRLTPRHNNPQEFADWWYTSRKRLHKESRKTFDSMVAATSWTIWKERNSRVFRSTQETADHLVVQVVDEARLWANTGYSHLQQLFRATVATTVTENGALGRANFEL
ncbi:hypothetical protein C2845_PM13G05910 [Panicum miliaceum]|uniref:Reverse transcriptase zinc-binding domain-containing protein n=1 Tax=Panicum miliaceum TaxID=4540 RepID=A0A3L6RMH1_PANMI|nr:hypothetical protein C2845_PM13G05910 [Panicum miliaceum]